MGEQKQTDQDVIDLQPFTDPVTGLQVWAQQSADPGLLPAVSIAGDGAMQVRTPEGPPTAVELTRERFAGEDQLPSIGDTCDWGKVESAQDAGRKVVMLPDGTFRIAGQGEADPASVTLTSNRFASGVGRSSSDQLPQERAAVQRLRASGVRWIAQLAHTSTVPGMPPGAPVGWLYRPRPNRYGDRLVCVVAFHPATRLYHSHLWRYDADIDGSGMKSIDLPRLLGRSPHLTHHKAHLYTASDGSGVLCLSERVSGGMATFETGLAQTLKWADGTGEVVRGRPFPYR